MRRLIASGLVALTIVVAAPAAANCAGDCSGNRLATVDEAMRCAAIALAQRPLAECTLCDVNDDGSVTVDDIIAVIRVVPNGCPAPTSTRTAASTSTDTPESSPTPTPTTTATASPTDSPTPSPTPRWLFTDVTVQAGVAIEHRYRGIVRSPDVAMLFAGVAAGDYDGDGWVDLYALGGETDNRLFRNRGDGTFAEVGAAAGVSYSGRACGPTFADIDGDGRLDLFVGGVEGTAPRVFRNLGNGAFEAVPNAAGLPLDGNNIGAAFGDYDRDGDLDVFISHWGAAHPQRISSNHLWRNDGAGTFSLAAEGTLPGWGDVLDYTFTPNFADLDGDGWPDLLVAADFRKSRILRNHGGVFNDATTAVISDENGMGAAVGDYDNDGYLDWFVSSVFDSDGHAEGFWGVTGNRLYRNRGGGSFEDVTDTAGVRRGEWGWGSCFADFNNDGFLDLFQVNGYGRIDNTPNPLLFLNLAEFTEDAAVLFINNGDGTFTERAQELGIADRGQGRGVVCFDYDRDGDIDVFIANNGESARLYRNDGGNRLNFLSVKLRNRPPNTEGIGARIYVTTAMGTQMRELRAGSNFVSQDPAVAHFGLGTSAAANELRVVWPNQESVSFRDVPANQFITVDATAGIVSGAASGP